MSRRRHQIPVSILEIITDLNAQMSSSLRLRSTKVQKINGSKRPFYAQSPRSSSLFPEHRPPLQGVLTRASRRLLSIKALRLVIRYMRSIDSQVAKLAPHAANVADARLRHICSYLDHQDQSRKRPEWTGMIRSRPDHVSWQGILLKCTFIPLYAVKADRK